jgi:hypothetical protein
LEDLPVADEKASPSNMLRPAWVLGLCGGKGAQGCENSRIGSDLPGNPYIPQAISFTPKKEASQNKSKGLCNLGSTLQQTIPNYEP